MVERRKVSSRRWIGERDRSEGRQGYYQSGLICNYCTYVRMYIYGVLVEVSRGGDVKV